MTALLLLIVLGALMHAVRDFAPDGVGFEAAGTELAFGFYLLAAYFGGKLLAIMRSPQLTGYLIVGVLAGPFVLDLVSTDMVADLRIVNGVAICLIALTAGGELSVRKMRPLLRTIRAMTLWAVIGTAILLTGTIMLMRPLLPFMHAFTTTQAVVVSLMLAVTLASQSPAVVMALINETKADGPVTQTALALVIIADLVVIVLYALASSLTTALIGGSVDVMATIRLLAWELLGSAVVGVFIGVLLALFMVYVKRGTALFVVLVCFVVAEVGIRLHLDPLIVTLVAGVYLENVSRADAHKLIHELEAASLPVYLVFFALAGASLNLGLLYAVLVPAAIIAVVRGVGFWLGSRYAARITDASPDVARWTWIGLLPQAGLALALALIMKKAFGDSDTFGSLGEQAPALVLGVVGLNQVLTPILLRFALIKSGEAGKREMHGALDENHPAAHSQREAPVPVFEDDHSHPHSRSRPVEHSPTRARPHDSTE